MIGVIIGTNRHNSISKKIGLYYKQLLESLGAESQIIDLSDLPEDFAFSALYHNSGKNELFNEFQKIVDTTTKFVFIVPEYNGSFPGVLKTFLDGLRYPDSFHYKKAALVGVSSGVQGNANGLGHLNDVLSYMQTDVLGLRIKLGKIWDYFDGKDFNPRQTDEINAYTNAKKTADIYKAFLEKQARQLIEL
ncbi:NADPH-dependent FMN reductase [Emticicia agri]|uniref:NADPH-dependent oxidoreductase n=1 Tax=Emticicia agri TaxID=2492393 RepID=A0A4V1ZDW3_9BACT|nr:NAD(P)H-dependent oxidoreductase [Emticicia agri]RYU97560.1 NADPH-dependent oxidoreductase [Emticicia agri]